MKANGVAVDGLWQCPALRSWMMVAQCERNKIRGSKAMKRGGRGGDLRNPSRLADQILLAPACRHCPGVATLAYRKQAETPRPLPGK